MRLNKSVKVSIRERILIFFMNNPAFECYGIFPHFLQRGSCFENGCMRIPSLPQCGQYASFRTKITDTTSSITTLTQKKVERLKITQNMPRIAVSTNKKNTSVILHVLLIESSSPLGYGGPEKSEILLYDMKPLESPLRFYCYNYNKKAFLKSTGF